MIKSARLFNFLQYYVVFFSPPQPSLRAGELSPAEGALVSAARKFGFVFWSRTPETIVVMEMGKHVTDLDVHSGLKQRSQKYVCHR